jgi:hypothetical protein
MPRPKSNTEDDGLASYEKVKDHNKICCWVEVERTEAYFPRRDATVVWRTRTVNESRWFTVGLDATRRSRELILCCKDYLRDT